MDPVFPFALDCFGKQLAMLYWQSRVARSVGLPDSMLTVSAQFNTYVCGLWLRLKCSELTSLKEKKNTHISQVRIYFPTCDYMSIMWSYEYVSRCTLLCYSLNLYMWAQVKHMTSCKQYVIKCPNELFMWEIRWIIKSHALHV